MWVHGAVRLHRSVASRDQCSSRGVRHRHAVPHVCVLFTTVSHLSRRRFNAVRRTRGVEYEVAGRRGHHHLSKRTQVAHDLGWSSGKRVRELVLLL